MLAAMFCVFALLGRGYAPVRTVCLDRGWEFTYPLLIQEIYVDLTIGLACFTGLNVYYSVCRNTRASAAWGTAFGALFSAVCLFVNIGRSLSPLLVFPFLYVIIVFLKNDQLEKERMYRSRQ